MSKNYNCTKVCGSHAVDGTEFVQVGVYSTLIIVDLNCMQVKYIYICRKQVHNKEDKA